MKKFKNGICMGLALMATMQVDSQYFEKDTIPSDMMKHVIFLDVTPAVAFAIQADVYDPVYALGYKYQRNPHQRLRAQVQYKRRSEQSGFVAVGVSDSLSLWYRSYTEMDQVQLRLGMEWGNYEKRVAPYYAVDIMTGHHRDHSSRSLYLGAVFENAYQLSNSEADTIVLNLPRLGVIESKNELGFESQAWLIGFAATFGLRVGIAPHWESWMEMIPEIIYLKTYRAIDTGSGSDIGTSGIAMVDFRFRLLNFGLAYKF